MTAKVVRVVTPLINYTELTTAVDAAITVSYFHDDNCGVMIYDILAVVRNMLSAVRVKCACLGVSAQCNSQQSLELQLQSHSVQSSSFQNT